MIWTQDTVYEILYGRLTMSVQATECDGFVHGKNMCGKFGYGMCSILETITRICK